MGSIKPSSTVDNFAQYLASVENEEEITLALFPDTTQVTQYEDDFDQLLLESSTLKIDTAPTETVDNTDRPISSDSNSSLFETIVNPVDDNHLRVLDQITLSKISRLKQQCIEKLGDGLFYKVYEILLEQREVLNAEPVGRDPYKVEKFVQMQERLDDLVPRGVNCMCVDELIYLESDSGFL